MAEAYKSSARFLQYRSAKGVLPLENKSIIKLGKSFNVQMAGRKGFGEELHIKTRYAALAEPYFKFLMEMFEGGDKKDKMWASEQLGKAYTRMIPTQMVGKDDGPIEIIKYAFGEYKDNLPSENVEQKTPRGEGAMEGTGASQEGGKDDSVPQSSD